MRVVVAVSVLVLAAGCGGSASPPAASERPSDQPAATAPGTTARPSGGRVARLGRGPAPATVATPAAPGTIRQWASSATATSNYGAEPGSSWNATSAIGAPDVDPSCADDPKAWASKARDERATLTVRFPRPVRATELQVYQTYNPGQVVELALLGPDGQRTVVYQGAPAAPDGCPVQGYLKGLEVAHPVDAVAITVDQSVLGTGWAEIDAVELVGTPVA